MSVIHVPKAPELGVRQVFSIAIVFLSLAIVFVRLWYLQVVKASELTERADAFRSSSVSRLAPRGLIVDRRGGLLAGVKSELVVTAVPEIVNRHPEVIEKLAHLTGMDAERIQERIYYASSKQYAPVLVLTGVTTQVATKVAESAADLPGIDVESQPVRYYPDGKTFAHVLGYVGSPADRDLARLEKLGIKAPDFVGKVGLEYIYERELEGSSGNDSFEVDAKGRPVRVVARNNPTAGNRLVLTIDSDLQRFAMKELEAARLESPDSGGAIVALDPRNGEVLCLASNPTYDIGMFTEGIQRSDFDKLSKDPMKPLFNRAISGSYSPGSTFKIVSSLAASKAGTLDMGRTVFCNGYYEVGNRRAKCLGHHGTIRFREALTRSCNTYFSDLAVRTGQDQLRSTALQVGLGQRSGIDLIGEGKAVVPTDDWLRAVRRLPPGTKPKWYAGDTVNMGIGQGELSATPLQMADLISLVANHGLCYRPHLLRATYPAGEEGSGTQVAKEVQCKVQADPDVWGALNDALVNVIEHGTAVRARIPGVVWAGKTGSTEHTGVSQKTHSWFVGYAPAENPVIAIAVLVERSGHGGEVSAPIAARVVESYLSGPKAPFTDAKAESKTP